MAGIEHRTNARLADLFYQMHWQENLMHREISREIGIPRPTVTRWFSELGVPSQPFERITKTYLKSWLYKTGQLRPKQRYEGPDRRLQEARKGVNVSFFKHWTPEMAYVLGFFAADGCLAKNKRGSHYIQFTSTDIGILRQIKRAMAATQAIRKKTAHEETFGWRPCYLFQIGSLGMYRDLLRLRLTPRKASRLELPNVPPDVLPDFVRGFFDGDGSVTYGLYRRSSRRHRSQHLLTCFTSASKGFLRSLHRFLKRVSGLQGGCLTGGTRAFHLQYSIWDSIRLFRFMYGDVDHGLFLRRKYLKFRRAVYFLRRGP